MRAPLRPHELDVPGFHRIEVVEEAASTNGELAAAVRAEPDAWPAPSALVAEHQTAGRGRAGRSWATPPRASLIVSVVLRPSVPAARLGWLPLLAGASVVRAVSPDDDGPGGLAVKWPNDVLVRADRPAPGLGGYRKVAGVLAEVLPTGGAGTPAAVVLGIGLNVSQDRDELPVATASSLALAGFGELDRTPLLATLLTELTDAVGRWEQAGGDPVGSGLADECGRVSATLGTRVRAELAGGSGTVEGEALRLDATGALVIRTDDGEERAVSAGDVHHLR
ncbi:biotin--[acetyl-CoA-carboxylase] ligase [Myceligenerans salitolerans]|uniref:biotin--[biotin carboxyl-carrier protein] ligase n=1 Tax=Myceligenerans salitolerans TaxID=1230528 RepID=A0ABS3I6A9_9MICO|nr:biotin--[acetyl-CoA-carboxylase] ligase [Myceligenerans salitolerans]MBO0607919.1 biotin--[acetyl-CoA-carboxylase] ligase [Myceligenerans salitolerans]